MYIQWVSLLEHTTVFRLLVLQFQQHLSESLEDETYVAHEWLPSSRSDRPLEDVVLLVTSRQVTKLSCDHHSHIVVVLTYLNIG